VETLVNATGVEQAAPPGLEPSGFADLYREHSKAVYYLALRYLGDPQRAEDVTHDVFLKVYRKLDEFRGESAFRTWLYRITINHCHNIQASWHNRHIVTTDDEAILDATPASVGESPLRIIEVKELGERIAKTMDGLTPEYRLLLLLVADEEMSYEEAGELTGQTPDAVRGKLHRARKAFAALFEKTA
jgi:RNA polymerase sigma-70 factor (ECF subfamily)